MGILHEVYQLKPKVLSDGAVLPLKKSAYKSFLKKYPKTDDDWGLFSNTFAVDSVDGRVMRVGIYSSDRILDFQKPGIYIAIQSGSKYGFDNTFEQNLSALAPFLEDCLLFVIWDQLITKFEIQNSVLSIQKTKNFNKWNYSFEKYLVSNYGHSPELIANYYVDKVIEMKLQIEDMIANDDDPSLYYELEEYQTLLDYLEDYKEYISLIEEVNSLKDWLREKIVFQKK